MSDRRSSQYLLVDTFASMDSEVIEMAKIATGKLVADLTLPIGSCRTRTPISLNWIHSE